MYKTLGAKIVPAVAIMLNLWSCDPQDIPPTSTVDELDKKIAQLFKSSRLPGVSMVVLDNTKILYQKSLGYSDLESQRPYDAETVQTIGSVSKTLIAFAIMKAQEMGKLDMDDPINDYLPFEVIHPEYLNAPITIRHLTQHTSGINDEASYLKAYVLKHPDQDYSRLPETVQEYIEVIKENKDIPYSEYLENVLSANGKWYTGENFTKDKPGTRYTYSNIGATLAALVVENATGTPFSNFTAQFVFSPLGMNMTSWEQSEANNNHFATRYFPDGTAVPDYHLITTPDGGLATNTSDFTLYLMEMLNGAQGTGKLLSQASYKEMYTRTKIGKSASGIFWSISEKGVLSHTGSDLGILSLAAINPKKNVAAFLMTNVSAEDDENLLESIQELWNTLKRHQWPNEQVYSAHQKYPN